MLRPYQAAIFYLNLHCDIFMNSFSQLKFKDNPIRSFFFVWIAAVINSVFYVPAIPRLIPANVHLRFSMNVFILISILQFIISSAIFAALGAYLAPRIGFRAYFAAVQREKKSDLWVVLKHQFSYGAPIGVVGAIIAYLIAPEFITYLNNIPLLPRLVLGGLTEEVIIRWGLMTILVWILWRVFQKGNGIPHDLLVYIGILLSQTLFAFGHYGVLKMAGVENLYWAVFTIFLVSLPWGWLFWKRGLESAIIAHASFHATIVIIWALSHLN